MKNIDLKVLSNSELLNETVKAVAQERELTNLVLEHLREIQRRRLYATLGYSSMFDYCTKHLKYCPASAQLRIDAMRLSSEVPEIRDSLEKGSLNLSVIGTFQKFIRHEKAKKKIYSTEEKKNFLKQVESKSKLDAEKFFAAISPEMIAEGPRQEKKRIISATQSEIKFVADDRLLALIDQMKAKLIQKGNPDPSYAEIIEAALKKALKIHPEQKECTASFSEEILTSPGEVALKTVKPEKTEEKPKINQLLQSRRPYIAVALRRAVFKKAQHQCSYVSLLTGRRCTETRFLQIEHQKPFALGGLSNLENLTLLCACHNRQRAIECYGYKKMQCYLRGR